MKEHPVLFSAPMVRAILAGKKTVTRRVMKSQPAPWEANPHFLLWEHSPLTLEQIAGHCPYGAQGDRLWVRETTRLRMLRNFLTDEPTNARCGEYSADGEPVLESAGFDLAWWYSRDVCPAIHMPRWASRIMLEITSVRIERLQDITEEEAQSEGIEAVTMGPSWTSLCSDGRTFETFVEPDAEMVKESGIEHFVKVPAREIISARDSFARLWDEINGKRPRCSWADSPWVWVIAFKRVEQS